ncbi:DNA polymerase III alpha subunit [Labilithrix luteola]|uniref:DNA polymerase III subunit alpha n=1 Tax=Labilithrix luteola TaxID=1391654 RepID=A0A0K1Q7J7_9BACT|nr:DNA polymerase III subunit alpha [Labilithrix luteola]AKV01786.1 DNA polymerase III alpha subunit [Labilithrix luteola]
MSEFVHLHVHSQYSMLDGAVKVKNLVKQVQKQGMNAVALTDHGNMFGAISFYKAAKEVGVKAILGSELEVVTGNHGHHLPLLAATEEGYKNLVWLVSRGYVEPDPNGTAGVPCVPLSALEGRTKGLIGMTGCMGGVVAQSILEQGVEAGRKTLERLKELFEPGSLYVELQDHGLPEQPVLKGILVDLAKRLDLPLVATNDVHYGARDDAEANLYLACIKSGRSYEEAKERGHGSSEMYLKSAEEMLALFKDVPEAVKNTLEISEKCQLKLKLGNPMLPTFKLPDGYDTDTYFRHVSHEGLEARFGEFEAVGKTVDREAYKKRLDWELDVICKMKFPGYFLIVWDFIRYGKENGVPVGPGRGSGAGSLVAYSLRITDLDPIPFNLLFERFLNPERVSMPDFDVDFCMDRRERVIQYVQRKYGEVSVGQIATFAELKAKSVIKDVARCLQFPPVEAQQIASLIPNKTPAETYTITESLTIEPKLKARFDTEPKVKELLSQAIKLEGLTRHAGKHAAGIVISEGPLWDHVPVFKDGKTDGYITQYYKDDVEQAGLVKFDFLGLKTLTVIDIAERLINARPDFLRDGKKLDVSKLRFDDKPAYQLMSSGETKGVFQLESSGMQQLFKDLQPTNFEDIVAAVALYRPGPLGTGMVKDFVDCKHGRKPIAKMHDKVDHLLEPTYGVIVYQEQVMQIAQSLAGYSLGGADLLRRAMGKKKPEEMAKQKGIFIEGSLKNGVEEADADRIFGLLEYFAGYGFNKSHSAAYALITYQTAYLKAHYPVELLCGIMTSDKEKIDKVVRTIADARAMGVTVLPPDVNESDIDFKVVYTHPEGNKRPSKTDRNAVGRDACGPQIRFGLGAVRGLGGAALEALLEARKEGGPFKDLFDFASRVDAKRINKGVFEALVQCGAFDTTLAAQGVSRAQAFASIETALERSRSASRDRERGQTNLFGLFDAGPKSSGGGGSSAGDYAKAEHWDRREMLVRERGALGFYVSGHPLERYLKGGGALAKLEAVACASLASAQPWSVVKVAGMVEGYRERIFKDGGGKIAFFDFEDLTGRVTCKVRGNQIDAYSAILTSGEPILITGKVSFPFREADAEEEEEGPKEPTLFLNEAVRLSDSVRSDTKQVAIRLHADTTSEVELRKMADVLAKSPGNCPVTLVLALKDGAEAFLALGKQYRVEVSDEVLSGLERVFGEQVAELR